MISVTLCGIETTMYDNIIKLYIDFHYACVHNNIYHSNTLTRLTERASVSFYVLL